MAAWNEVGGGKGGALSAEQHHTRVYTERDRSIRSDLRFITSRSSRAFRPTGKSDESRDEFFATRSIDVEDSTRRVGVFLIKTAFADSSRIDGGRREQRAAV